MLRYVIFWEPIAGRLPVAAHVQRNFSRAVICHGGPISTPVARACSRLTIRPSFCAVAGQSVTLVYTIYNTGNVVVRNLSVTAPGLGQLTCLQDGSSIEVGGQVQCRYALTAHFINPYHQPRFAHGLLHSAEASSSKDATL